MQLSPAAASALAAVGLLLVGLMVFGPYVRHGGFIDDDWATQALSHFTGFSGTFSYIFSLDTRRPLQALYAAVVGAALGGHQHWHIAVSVGIWMLNTVLVLLVLRELRAGLLTATAVAALVLLFPFADSLWLWASGGSPDTAVALWLLGLLVALHALRARKRGWAWHVLASALMAASVLAYEATLVVAALSGALYLLMAPRRVALRRWVVDIGAIAVAVLLFSSQLIDWNGVDVHQTESLQYTLNHAKIILDQGLSVGAASFVPSGAPNRWPVLAVLLVLVCVAGLVAGRTSDAVLARDLKRHLMLAGGGLVVTIGGWAMFAPADVYYSPATLGVGNRVNLIAAIGLAALVVASAQLAVKTALAGTPTLRRNVGALLVLGAVVIVAAGYLSRLGVDKGAWTRSDSERYVVLTSLRRDVPRLSPGSTVIATGFPVWEAPGVPVFATSWDLNGAVQLLWNDYSLQAWPMGPPPDGLRCTGAGVTVQVSSGYPPAAYGKAVLVNVGNGEKFAVNSLRECRKLAGAMARGI
jgi:hypothetical protein